MVTLSTKKIVLLSIFSVTITTQSSTETSIQTNSTVSTTPFDPSHPSNVRILVLAKRLRNSVTFSGDGEILERTFVFAPSQNFADTSAYAVVQGTMYIFGGYSDSHKIAKLESCRLSEISIRLINSYEYAPAALAIENGHKALICFAQNHREKCEIFDTVESTSTHSTKYEHHFGGFGYYNGQPTTVGSAFYWSFQKVETYSSSGWNELADHPKKIYRHTLTGLDSGAMLMVGGRDAESEENRDIWLLKEGIWDLIGYLQHSQAEASALKVGDYIYIVPREIEDSDGLLPIERIQVSNDEVIETKVIARLIDKSTLPVVFEIEIDSCF
ncbi:Oidioi.mRNA.OKI2018_I69.chr2.g4432.t1.cds [Oikopleura dioica]|uniref:Oidioi.mRNA.OKI2018_I69.chr2.g4432.t1.cds n=1 Tax=Oikopleura dioica TaxID=34765 RepID=A0ABN7SX18_OIKDI|nr:Oidioi.mRNA.OKI2018_I69.chr2.g4432.t1.cds [Oikopleura dioica]